MTHALIYLAIIGTAGLVYAIELLLATVPVVEDEPEHPGLEDLTDWASDVRLVDAFHEGGVTK